MDNTNFKITEHIDNILTYVYKNRDEKNSLFIYKNGYDENLFGISFDQLIQCHQYMTTDELIIGDKSDLYKLNFILTAKAIRQIEGN